MVYSAKPIYKWMIWGYPHFRKLHINIIYIYNWKVKEIWQRLHHNLCCHSCHSCHWKGKPGNPVLVGSSRVISVIFGTSNPGATQRDTLGMGDEFGLATLCPMTDPCMPYMVTFTINIPQMLAYIYIHSSFLVTLTNLSPFFTSKLMDWVSASQGLEP